MKGGGGRLDVLVIGGLSFDYIGSVDGQFREDSLTVQLESLARSYGGRGANFAVFARALGCDVRLVSAVGDDFTTSDYHAELKKRGIDIGGLYWNQAGGETQHVFTFTNADDSRIYVFRDREPETEIGLRRWAVQSVESACWDAVYCTSEIPSVNAEALQASADSLKVFSPGPDLHRYDPGCLRACLEAADIILVNVSEMQLLESFKEGGIPSLLHNLTALVVTQGGRGCVVHCAANSFHVSPSLATKVVDTTGAGDAYAAGFVAEFMAGQDLLKAARTGSAVASFVIEARGCQTVVPNRSDVAARLKASYGHGYADRVLGW